MNSISTDVGTAIAMHLKSGRYVMHPQMISGVRDCVEFLQAANADTPLDFDSMKEVGSMLGTGAVIVIGEGRNLFAIATNIVRFFRNESCGKCVPCRVGSEKAVQLLEEVSSGSASPAELAVLPELGETLEQTSICGLGQVALNPILSMMQHFPEEVPKPS